MGSRRLPGKKALAAALVLGLAGLAAACTAEGEEAEELPTSTATAPSAAVATATPDPFGTPPRDAKEAASRLAPILAKAAGPCSDAAALHAAWGAACASGDVDGNGLIDVAVLVPLPTGTGQTPHPGVVLLRREGREKLEQFPPAGEADASIVGRSIFAVAERTGDGRADVVLLANACGASTCSSRVYVQSWDGSAWRDLGPGEGMSGLGRIAFDGNGTGGRLVMHGGILNSPGAGPQRAVTVTYVFDGVRWGAKTVVPDEPTYLFHAIRDADAHFAQGKFEEASEAYRAAIESKELRDWRAEMSLPGGRDELVAYALFRIAVAVAARGQDPSKAVDAVIRDGKSELFVNAAMAFRKGLQDQLSVNAGCLEVTQYLGTPGIPEMIERMFDYGFANHPLKGYRDICPL
ncbi:MAG: tetratricopeptide repeat protein [Dehalococcoidia bacterium]|nr:tetratricopeptide repeat protein [Dehalococcoidia bacterium]